MALATENQTEQTESIPSDSKGNAGEHTMATTEGNSLGSRECTVDAASVEQGDRDPARRKETLSKETFVPPSRSEAKASPPQGPRARPSGEPAAVRSCAASDVVSIHRPGCLPAQFASDFGLPTPLEFGLLRSTTLSVCLP